MGSILYGHLNNSILLDASLIAAAFAGVSEQELQSALQAYRTFCLANLDTLMDEVAAEADQLRLYVGDTLDRKLLKQGAFYLDRGRRRSAARAHEA